MSNASSVLQTALQHHQSGNLAEAERLYRAVIAQQPFHADAHHFLGVLVLQQGQPAAAVEHLQKAIECNPDVAPFQQHLGTALEAAGRPTEAVAALRQALKIDPRSAEAHHVLGGLLKAHGQFTEAEASYRAALRSNARYVAAHNDLGLLLGDQGRLDEAREAFQAASRLRPDLPQIHFNLGNCARAAGNVAVAAASYRRALAIDPRLAAAHHNLGIVLQQDKQYAEAAAAHRAALDVAPAYAEAHEGLGIALQALGQFESAKASYQRALELKPGSVSALYNLATACHAEARYEQAEELFQKVLLADPGHHAAYCGLGAVYVARGDWPAVELLSRKMLALWPGDVHAEYFRATYLLTTGQLPEGWDAFECRFAYHGPTRRPIAAPRWDGSPLAGRRLLVYAEFGLGDALNFVRYLPLLHAREPDAKVIVEMFAALIPLLEQSGYPGLVSHCPARGEFDLEVPLMSLPALFGTTLAAIPAQVPYLQADPQRVETWRARLADVPGFRVGLFWQGNPDYARDRHRSIPLGEFVPLARVPGVTFFGLQQGFGSQQIEGVRDRLPLVTLGERGLEAGSFVEMAAVLKNLDLVITSDTGPAHLAGALGVPVWVALSKTADWRWLLDREDCPWYPSMRLFRQQRLDEWSKVFERIAAALAEAVATR